MRKDDKNKGFSLVELIIVIAIMAVLVGLLAPQYLKYVEKSKIQRAISNTKTVAEAINVVLTDTASFDSDAYSALLALAGHTPIDLSSDEGAFLRQAIDSELTGEVNFINNGDLVSFTYTMVDGKIAVDYNMTDSNHHYIYETGNYHAYYK